MTVHYPDSYRNEHRLHGPPGTGKTWTLSKVWVPRAVDRFGRDAVVICSLTRTAAAEIRGRGVPLPKGNVGTLHSLCYRGLGCPEIAETKVAEWSEEHPEYAIRPRKLVGLEEVEDEAGRQPAPLGERLLAEVQTLRHRMVPVERWPGHLGSFQAAWEGWKTRRGYADFTDLIESGLGELETAPGQPAVLILDEAQDCSALEMALIRKWGTSTEFTVLAGDSDQAIYSWRGAMPRAFLEPEIPEENNRCLTQSYRVPRAVHDVAVRWIEQAAYRYAVDYAARDAEGEVVRAEGLRLNRPEATLAVVEEDLVQGETVMVLASCGYMLGRLLRVLRLEGVPFHNPHRPNSTEWNPLKGSAQRLVAFLRPDSMTHGEHARPWSWVDLAAWVPLLKGDGILAPGAKAEVRKRARRREGAVLEVKPTEGRAILGAPVWDSAQAALAAGVGLEWLREHVLPSKLPSLQYGFTVADRHGSRALVERPKLVTGTVHSTKGGEADTVLLFPDLSPSAMRQWLHRGEPRDSVLRVMYVGMTRARERLHLCGRSSTRAVTWPVPTSVACRVRSGRGV